MEHDIQNCLLEALKDRFKASVIIDAIEEEIISIAETETFEKYKKEIIYANGMEFELIGVNASYYPKYLKKNKVSITLAFFCKSKLPKEKRERLEQMKVEYKTRKRVFLWNNYKIPIWRQVNYEVELEKVLSRQINLILPY